MLRCLTAGESHGKCLVAILEGMPAGIKISEEFINAELKRRQGGYGRGPRMKIEKDRVQILGGLRKGLSIGSPIAVMIENKDFSIEKLASVTAPRPGHADLAGVLKYGFNDARDVLERASARQTAATVAVGALCKIFLKEFKVNISSRVVMVHDATSPAQMKKEIGIAKANGDTVGGIVEVIARAVPVGLGSYAQADRRLDSRLCGAIMSIPGIKAVEVGLGFGYASKTGSEVQDAIYYKNKGFVRETNNAGGIEGGISNGEPIILRFCMKPIATLMQPLASVDIISKKTVKASVQRSDTCVVEAAGVVAENVVAYVLSDALLEKFGGDSLKETKYNLKCYLAQL